MFGWSIIRTERLKELEYLEIKTQKFWLVHRWFAGWRDLDIIWNYFIQDTNFGGIERARKDYAEARKTDEYGRSLEAVDQARKILEGM